MYMSILRVSNLRSKVYSLFGESLECEGNLFSGGKASAEIAVGLVASIILN